MLTNIINGLIDILVFIMDAVLMLLPDTPFQFEQFDWGPFGSAIGFIFPIHGMVTHTAALLTAFAIYYSVRWILRVIRQVR